MRVLHNEFIRYQSWKEQFLKDYKEISSKDVAKKLYPQYVGGYERRLEDQEVRYWTN